MNNAKPITVNTNLKNIIESSFYSPSLIVTDTMGYITDLTESAKILLNTTKHDVIGKHLNSVLIFKKPVPIESIVMGYSYSGLSTSQKLLGKNTRHIIYYKLIPIYDDSMTVTGISLMLDEVPETDFTAKQKVNDGFNEYSAYFAHVLRTPLSSLSCAAKTFKDHLNKLPQSPDNKKSESLLRIIERSGYKLTKNVECLTAYQELISDSVKLKLSYEDISEFTDGLCYAVSDYLKSLYCDFDKEIVADLPQEDLIAAFDTVLFERILLIILSNCIRSTVAKGKINVSMDNDENYLTLVIVYTGKALPYKSEYNLNGPFSKWSMPDSNNYDIYVLELTIAQLLVQLHKGQLWINGEDDGENTVTIKLPRIKEKNPKIAQEPTEKIYNDRSYNMLVEFSDIED